MASTKIIRAPSPVQIYWSATRARNFARIVSGNPKRRSTYDENIRLLDAVYSKLVGEEGNPLLFMKKVNPLAFAWMNQIPTEKTQKILVDSHHMLWLRLVNSKCFHCRKMAKKVKV